MPLSAAEKMKRRREKLKGLGKYEDYKKKHAEICKKSRAKKKVDNLPSLKRKQLQRDLRKIVNERVKKFRSLKKKQSAEFLIKPLRYPQYLKSMRFVFKMVF